MTPPSDSAYSDQEIESMYNKLKKPSLRVADDMSDEEIESRYNEVNQKPKESQAQTALESFGQGAALGYLPQLQAKTQPYFDTILSTASRIGLGPKGGEDVEPDFSREGYIKARDENIKRQERQKQDHPATALLSQLGGGIATGVATAPLFAAKVPAAASSLQTIAAASKSGLLQGGALGLLQNPGDIEGKESGPQAGERLAMGAISAPLGGLLGAAGGALSRLGRGVKSTMTPEVKPNVGEITQSLDDLGKMRAQPDVSIGGEPLAPVEPPLGMLASDTGVQKMESSLGQSPFRIGVIIREKIQKVWDAVNAGVTSIDDKATKQTAAEIGEQIKADISEKVAEKYAPTKEIYSKLSGETENIGIAPNRLKIVANNIRNHIDAVVENKSIAARIADDLENTRSVYQLQRLRTHVLGLARESAREKPTASRFLYEIGGKIDRLERGSITRAAVEAAGEKQGGQLANGMINELKTARKGYREIMEYIQELGGHTGIKGKNTVSTFLDTLDSMEPITLAEKMFKPKGIKAMGELKILLPEVFENLRQLELQKVLLSSLHKGTDKVNYRTLVSKLYSYPKETQLMLLGEDGLKTIGNIKTVINNAGAISGPSGTPGGLQDMQFGSPMSMKFWADIFNRYTKKSLYEGALNSANKRPYEGLSRMMDKTSKGLIGVGDNLSPSMSSAPGSLKKYMDRPELKKY